MVGGSERATAAGGAATVPGAAVAAGGTAPGASRDAALAPGAVAAHTPAPGAHHLLATDITRIYTDQDGNEVMALEHFDLEANGDQIIGLIGPSGCGKSTFLRLVAGLDGAQVGTLSYNGEPIVGTDYRRGLVFQNAALFEWLTVFENIAFGLRARKVFKQQRDEVQRYIDLMGLTGFEQSYPHQVSGGMASRTALARSFIQQPGVILLDEPLASLDAFTRETIQDQIIEMQAQAHALIILVTHDIEEAVYLCDRILVMSPRPGRIIGEVAVGLTHPRDRTGERFIAYRREVMALLRGQQAPTEPTGNNSREATATIG